MGEAQIIRDLTDSESIRRRFRRLVADWKDRSKYLSNTAQMAMLRPYQQIIGMGPAVVPLLLEELRDEPDQWFWPWSRSPRRTPCHRMPQATYRYRPRPGPAGVSTRACSPHDRGSRLPAIDGRQPSSHEPRDPSAQLHRLVGRRRRSLVAARRLLAHPGHDRRFRDGWADEDVRVPRVRADRVGEVEVDAEPGLMRMFESLGFERTDDASLAAGIEKVALYALPPFYTHAARQLPSGIWTSKLGRSEDIEHSTPDDVAGGTYGEVAAIMARPGRTPSSTAAS